MLAPLAVTMGEPAGIGGEILLKAWARRTDASPVFFGIDSTRRLEGLAAQLKVPCPVIPIAAPGEAASAFTKGLPVLDVGELGTATLGKPTSETAKAVIGAIDRAVALVQAGSAGAMITNPIQKAVL